MDGFLKIRAKLRETRILQNVQGISVSVSCSRRGTVILTFSSSLCGSGQLCQFFCVLHVTINSSDMNVWLKQNNSCAHVTIFHGSGALCFVKISDA